MGPLSKSARRHETAALANFVGGKARFLIDGDTMFPEIDPDVWQAAHEEAVPAGGKDSHPTRYVVWGRTV